MDRKRIIEILLPPVIAFLVNSVVYWGAPRLADNGEYHNLSLALDTKIPLLPAFILVYFGCYIFWVINYLLVSLREEEIKYRFFTADLYARIICFLFFVFYPTTNVRPELVGNGIFVQGMRFLYQIDEPVNLFPSIHCMASWFCCIGIRGDKKVPVWYKIVSVMIAGLVFVSTLVTKQHVIVDVIGGYVTLKRRGNSYMACCPFHHEKTPSFHVNRDKQMYHCFGCGVGGNVITFVMEYENFSFPEALKMLAERAGVALPEQNYSREQRQRENYKMVLKEMNRTAAIYFNYLLTATSAGKHALEYYHDRGFSDETIQRFGLGYANIYENDLYQYLKKQGYTDAQMKDSGLVRIDERRGGQDMFWNRAMVPIMDINGKVVGFGGRVLGDGTPKYINTKETAVFDKSHTLFAMNIARRSKRRGIILCEGYMDVIAMHQAGFDNAAASLGTALTMGHATIVKRYTDEVYLAYDSDGAGRKATMKAIGIMREVGISTRIIDLKPYKDPDEFIHNLGKEAFEGRIADAVTGIVFEIDGIAQGYNLRDPEEKIRFTKEAAKRLSALDEPVVRHSYIEAVAEKYKIDAADLKAMVTR